MTIQEYKKRQLSQLTSKAGVYALCDLDQIPIYVGQSKGLGGIRARVQRHLTSARSDVIANRQLDVWEVGFVWAWALKSGEDLDHLEFHIFHHFNEQSPLVNGKEPPRVDVLPRDLSECQRLQILSDEELTKRRDPRYRLPRQVQQVAQLLDYILNVQDKTHLRRSLRVHYQRLTSHYSEFARHEATEVSDDGDDD